MSGSKILSSEVLESILLGGSFEEKTRGWDLKIELPDDSGAGSVIASSVLKQLEINGAPTRFGKVGSAVFPKERDLLNPSGRGRLLHFFANHELLAIESMAYVLLKFPDAPAAFRQGVLKTLQDEQRHLRTYRDRMEQLGVGFGDLPMNLYFWNTMKTIESPLDFVVRMGLTFEQANLDFALEYLSKIEETGDRQTADVLRVVHDDEVQHVKHGLKWFDHFRDPSLPAFEAYRRQLKFPLTPRRARGARFSSESRRQAGFSEELISCFETAGGSRGRQPDLYFYYPMAEVDDVMTTVPKHLMDRVLDLEILMLWLTKESDVLLVRQEVPTEFLLAQQKLKGELPELRPLDSQDTKQVFASFRPWAWGRAAFQMNHKLKFQSPFTVEEQTVREKFFSKSWWRDQLAGFIPFQVCDSLPVFWDKHPDCDRALVKASHGSSGRGHQVVSRQDLGQDFNAMVFEPLFDRIADFSSQGEVLANNEIKIYPTRYFKTDAQFQYQGAYFGADPVFVDAAVRMTVRKEEEQRLKLMNHVAKTLIDHGYVGSFAVDHLAYRDRSGEMQIYWAVEVNVRYTMGRVALEIEKHLSKRFKNLNQADWLLLSKKQAGGNFLDWIKHEQSTGMILIPTNPVANAREVLSVIRVRKTGDELRS